MPNCYGLVTKIGDHMRSKHSVERQQMFNEDLNKKLLQEYKKWQESPDSGGLSSTSVKNNTSNVKLLFSFKELSTFNDILSE